MNRRALASALVVSSLVLSSCSLDPEPKPDPTLTSLAVRARDDAAALAPTNPAASALRSAQADQLFAEVSRLCGTYKDGSVPPACATPSAQPTAEADLPSADVLARAQSELLDAAPSISAESMPQAAAVFTQLSLLHSPADLAQSNESLGAAPASDTEAAQEALKWENGVIFGLKVALAYSGSAAGQVRQALSVHQDRAGALRIALAQAHEQPAAPEAAYDLSGYPSLADADSARRFLIAVDSDTVSTYARLASASTDGAWRAFALLQAGTTAAEVGELLTAAGQDPLAADFAQFPGGKQAS